MVRREVEDPATASRRSIFRVAGLVIPGINPGGSEEVQQQHPTHGGDPVNSHTHKANGVLCGE
jgi:hypothetical protein